MTASLTIDDRSFDRGRLSCGGRQSGTLFGVRRRVVQEKGDGIKANRLRPQSQARSRRDMTEGARSLAFVLARVSCFTRVDLKNNSASTGVFALRP